MLAYTNTTHGWVVTWDGESIGTVEHFPHGFIPVSITGETGAAYQSLRAAARWLYTGQADYSRPTIPPSHGRRYYQEADSRDIDACKFGGISRSNPVVHVF